MTLLLAIVLHSIVTVKVEQSFNTMSTHDAIFLAFCSVLSICGDHDRSLDSKTLTVAAGVIIYKSCPWRRVILYILVRRAAVGGVRDKFIFMKSEQDVVGL